MLIATALIAGCTGNLMAQEHQTSDSDKKKQLLRYVLPDGRLIAADKLDSVQQAWGPERVINRHTEADDAKGVVHLDRMTDQMLTDMKANVNAQTHILTAMVGHTATDFSVTDLQGNLVHLAALKGKIVVLNFWFTTCPPCIAEMPKLNQMVEKYSNRGVVFLALTFNDTATVTNFMRTHQFNYDMLPAAKEAIASYGIHNYPTHLVIGKDGLLSQYFVSGENIETELSKAIEARLYATTQK